MRKTLIDHLLKTDHKDRYFLTADVGYGLLEPLRDKMKGRFINIGIAEQSMISIATGLALSGKEVWTYTMCCFYLRALEQIKLDACYHKVPINMIGVGVGFDYEQHGSSHFALEDGRIVSALAGVEVYTPRNKKQLLSILRKKHILPRYIRISRFDSLKSAQPILKQYPKYAGSLDYLNKTYGNKKQKISK